MIASIGTILLVLGFLLTFCYGLYLGFRAHFLIGIIAFLVYPIAYLFGIAKLVFKRDLAADAMKFVKKQRDSGGT